MKISKFTASLFLGILLFSTLLALSVYVLKVQFCAVPLTHEGPLCHVVNRLSNHNFFGTAIASLIVVFSAIVFAVAYFGRDVFFINRQIRMGFVFHDAPLSFHPILSWLALHYNSPNFSLGAR